MITSVLHTWKIGAKSLLLHPLRSSLTILGIFIGVASVIWLLAIGEGISAKAQEQIAGLGANNIIVRSIKPPQEQMAQTLGPPAYGLTRADLDGLTGTIETIDRAVPIREKDRQTFSRGDRQVEGRLVGCTPEYAEITQLQVDRGHFITSTEDRKRRNVCCLSAEVAAALFPFDNPLGDGVRVGEQYYTVVGVMKPRGPTAAIGGSLAAQDFSSDIYIPIHTFWSRLGDFIITPRAGSFESEIVEISQITLRVKTSATDTNEDIVLDTADMIRDQLDRSHKTPDYGLTIPLELIEQAKTTRMMFILFLGMIAAISLIVGGIGIMNIMLATVTERTREIGIRRALGAKRLDIILQFLAETVMLSVLGGLIGILGGLFCKPVVNMARGALKSAFPQRFDDLPDVIQTMTPEIVNWSIPLAFVISVVVGVIFGIYPAIRAALMHPVEALRHE